MPFGVAEPRLERQRIDEAEHRRVGADAEANDQRGDDRESGLAGEQPEAVAQVLQERAHGPVRRKRLRVCFAVPRQSSLGFFFLFGLTTRPL